MPCESDQSACVRVQRLQRVAHLNTLATKRRAEERRVASIAGVKVRYEAPDVTIIILALTEHHMIPYDPYGDD